MANNATAVEMIKQAHSEDVALRAFITDVNEFHALTGSNTDTNVWAAYQVCVVGTCSRSKQRYNL